MKKLRTKMIAAGATRPTRINVEVDIVSTVSGKEMFGSAMLKGRRLGTIWEKAAPTAATALQSVRCNALSRFPSQWPYIITTQSMMYEIISRTDTGLRVISINAITFRLVHFRKS